MDLIAVKGGICTGCTACLNACPNACIDMVEDREGFLYPTIDQEACLNCNTCNTICPAIKDKEPQKKVEVYAAINPNEEVREESTSGGVFTTLAHHVLEKGGVVYGAAFDEDWTVHHVRATTMDELAPLRGAKYLQSQLDFIFEKVEDDLIDGKTVLFSGTPCQVDGLNAVFLKDYDNLLTCSVVCHGVPSTGVFKKYLKVLEGRFEEGIKSICFRWKTPSWRHYSFLFKGEHQTYTSPVAGDDFMKGFIDGLYERPSCYNCPSKPNSADIMLGDYWGVEHFHKKLDDDKGTSVVIVQTPKGATFFDAVKDELMLEESSFEKAIAYNPVIVKSGKPSPQRAAFFDDYQTKDFIWLSKKYLKETKAQYLTRVAKHIVMKCLGYLKPTKEN